MGGIELMTFSTTESILAYASERISRRTYKKLLSKAEDTAAVKALNEQLTHAFHVFEVRCVPLTLTRLNLTCYRFNPV